MKNTCKITYIIAVIGAFLLLASCTSIPEKAEPVTNFDVNKYQGTWYEIARFDFRFEKDMDNVSAQYSLDDKGNVVVLNSGFNYEKEKWEKAEGKAKSRGAKDVGALKVSFFGPFYSGYNVIALDENYNYALIAGKNLDYLWILSRTTEIPEDVKNEYLEKAKQIGYDTTQLIWVKHDREDNPYLEEK